MQCKPFTSLFFFFPFFFPGNELWFMHQCEQTQINLQLQKLFARPSHTQRPHKRSISKKAKWHQKSPNFVTLLQLSIGCRCSFSYPPNPLNKRTSSIRVKKEKTYVILQSFDETINRAFVCRISHHSWLNLSKENH